MFDNDDITYSYWKKWITTLSRDADGIACYTIPVVHTAILVARDALKL